ncbi:MAG TPA: peptidyl-prolyl cis-trans isomerase [Solirubrobacterales bacterium]|nr:peptidyl-prolyl cis-trans isomerase [Solirubrobacterales bacterium]
MGAKSGRKKPTQAQAAASKGAGARRFALVVFGALFIALFVVFAVAQGIGQPSVPDGDVAIVKSVPDGNVSEAEFKRSFVQQAAGAELKKVPKPGSKKYEELKTSVMTELLQTAWIRGEAEELGISVTAKQVESELAQIKKSNWPTEKAFQEFLKKSKLTEDEVNDKVESQVLVQELQQKITNESGPASAAEIQDYYEAEKAAQFTSKETRDVRLIVNRNKKKAEEAKEALDEDNSDANWKVVAKKFSVDPTTKNKGGLQKEISEEFLQGVLKKAIFESATGEVVGPVGFQGNYFVLQVEKLNPEKVKTLAEVRSQISTQLTEQKQQAFFAKWVEGFESKWRSRTYCASDFAIPNCANYKSSGHPSTAPAACYEANPKTPATECPAPVEQIKPALPGTVTKLKPTGEQLVQRPRPPVTSKQARKEAIEEKVEERVEGAGGGE